VIEVWLVLVGGCAGVAGAVRAVSTRRRRRTIAMLPDRIAPRQVGLDCFPSGGAGHTHGRRRGCGSYHHRSNCFASIHSGLLFLRLL